MSEFESEELQYENMEDRYEEDAMTQIADTTG